LLAEDHPVNQKVAVRMLEHLGHSVVVVADGAKALAALQSGRFDVVLMDLQMPEMDGFEALRAIRAREENTGDHTPVIALTAHAMQGDRQRCLDAGFDGYVAKPMRQADLQSALERLEPLETFSSTLQVGSLIEELTEICGGDEDFAHELALTFLQSAPSCLAAIEQSFQCGDWRELSAQAHALKGISRTIGAANLAQCCVELENASTGKDLSSAARAAPAVAGAWEAVKTTLEDFLAVEVKS
jgi:CheY-like chemotaxis protein/HPt (histidine-containing phosphotransfer) domain-containing protein